MKTTIYNISKYIILAVALLQLAISQIHIEIITKVYETNVGFYLFLFIIFGLVVAFNSISNKKKSKMFIDLFGSVVAVFAGYQYITIVFANIAPDRLLNYQDIQYSIYISIAAIAIYIIGTIILFLTNENVR